MRIPQDQATEARRAAATRAFVQRRHELYHQYNGADAACEVCGTTRMPAWMRRAQQRRAADLTGAVRHG